MLTRKSSREFRESGLFWFANTVLHAFGWAIVWDPRTDTIYLARVQFRGFDEDTTSDGYIRLTEYMKANVDTLLEEAKK